MIQLYTSGGVKESDIKLKSIPASLFSRDEGFGVFKAENSGGSVDEVKFDLLIDESHTLEFEASDHPIENGAVITDHVTQKLRTCTITGMFTNSPMQEFGGSTIESFQKAEVKGDGGEFEEGRTNRSRDEMFGALERMAMERKPVRLVTALKVYPEMIILSLPVKRSAEDGESVEFTMTLREFKIATLKKSVAFQKYNPKKMNTPESRKLASKSTKGKVSATGRKLVEAVIQGGGFGQ